MKKPICCYFCCFAPQNSMPCYISSDNIRSFTVKLLNILKDTRDFITHFVKFWWKRKRDSTSRTHTHNAHRIWWKSYDLNTHAYITSLLLFECHWNKFNYAYSQCMEKCVFFLLVFVRFCLSLREQRWNAENRLSAQHEMSQL